MLAKRLFEDLVTRCKQKGIIPLNLRNEKEPPAGMTSNGTPCCSMGFPMTYWGADGDVLKFRCPHATGKVDCPLGMAACSFSNYGMVVKVDTTSDLRRYSTPHRDSKRWKELYNERTSVERCNSRLKTSTLTPLYCWFLHSLWLNIQAKLQHNFLAKDKKFCRSAHFFKSRHLTTMKPTIDLVICWLFLRKWNYAKCSYTNKNKSMIVGLGGDPKVILESLDGKTISKTDQVYYGKECVLCKVAGNNSSYNLRLIKIFDYLLEELKIRDEYISYINEKSLMLIDLKPIWAIIAPMNSTKKFVMQEHKNLQDMISSSRVFSPQMPKVSIDWSSISAGNFEKLCKEILIKKGFADIRHIGNTNAADGGRDIMRQTSRLSILY